MPECRRPGCTGQVTWPRRYCEWCREKVALVRDSGVRRKWCFLRDRGVCQLCRRDTEALRAELANYDTWLKAMPHEREYLMDLIRPRIEALRAEGFAVRLGDGWFRLTGRLWEADHVVPQSEKGRECDLSNLRTLCLPCHHRVTAELQARLKRRRRWPKAEEARGISR